MSTTQQMGFLDFDQSVAANLFENGIPLEFRDNQRLIIDELEHPVSDIVAEVRTIQTITADTLTYGKIEELEINDRIHETVVAIKKSLKPFFMVLNNSNGYWDELPENRRLRYAITAHLSDQHEQGLFQGNTYAESIFQPDLVGYVSENVGTPAGFVTGKITNRKDVLEMLFHLPSGYRKRCAWFMHLSTGLKLADVFPEHLDEDGFPISIANKPVFYLPTVLPDDYRIVLADLSRGYLLGGSSDIQLVTNTYDGKPIIVVKVMRDGHILSRASFKFFKENT